MSAIQIIDFPDRTEYTRRGRFHRTDGPAIEFQNGSEEWFLNGKRTRADGPAVVRKDIVGEPLLEQWWVDNKLSRVGEPAVIRGLTEEWYTDGKRNNIGDAAFKTRNEAGDIIFEQWWVNGKLSRVGAPAVKRITNESINKQWLLERVPLDSSEQPPPSGVIEPGSEVTIEEWWLDGVLHRVDGPAVIITNSDNKIIREEYWLNGKRNGLIVTPSNAWVDVIETNDPIVTTTRVTIPVQDYKTQISLLNALKAALDTGTSKTFSYQYNSLTNIVTFSYVGQGDVQFRFSEDSSESLGSILGFPPSEGVIYSFVNKILSAPSEMVFEPLPAVEIFEGLDADNNSIYSYQYWTEGLKTRVGGPAIIQFVNTPPDENKRLTRLFNYFWYEDDVLTREDGPALVLSNGTEEWYRNGVLHRDDGPAVSLFLYKEEDGTSLFDQYWYTDGKLNREGDLPAVERANGCLEWYIEDVRTRVGAPAITKLDGSEFWYLDGVLHREDDEPAVVEFVGISEDEELGPVSLFNKYWYTNGQLNRVGAPAVENADGSFEWYSNGKLNREGDLPAVERSNGDQEWWIDGELTREDNPAIIYADGSEVWITARPIGTNLIITEPKDIPLTSSFVRGLLPSIYVSNVDSDFIDSRKKIEDIFKVYGEITDLVYASTYALITYSSEASSVAAIAGEDGKTYGTMMIHVSDFVLSLTQVGRVFTVGLEVLPRPVLSSIINKVISEVGIFTRFTSDTIFITEPLKIVYPQSVIESLFENYSEQIISLTKSGRIFTIQFNTPVRDIFSETVSRNIRDLSVTVKTAQSGQAYRDEEPAIITNDSRIWMVNGRIERLGGEPAIEFNNGDKHWYLAGELHREDDLPAIERANGDREWFLFGKRSRAAGPAVILANGSEEWWIDGCQRRDGDLPSRKEFVGFVDEQKLWIKTYPFPNFKGALKRSITGNGRSTGQLVWETDTYEEGLYYYVSQSNNLNQGTIRLLSTVGPPEDRIFDVTITLEGRFHFEGQTIAGDPLSADNPILDVRVGDRLILNLNNRRPAFDFVWSTDGVIVRANDQPAVIRWNGDQEWYLNGKLGRINDQPAIVRTNGDQEWYINGLLNRINDQPAIVRSNGDQEWYLNGILNRFNGPAIVRTDGTVVYYVCGRRSTEAEYLNIVALYDDFCVLLPLEP
jgi:hypothetical protein